VSSDDHVLDGHHQWLAARENGEDVKVIRLGAPIEDLLTATAEFPSSTTSEGAATQLQATEASMTVAPSQPTTEQLAAPAPEGTQAAPVTLADKMRAKAGERAGAMVQATQP